MRAAHAVQEQNTDAVRSRARNTAEPPRPIHQTKVLLEPRNMHPAMHHGSNIRPCNAVAKVAHVCAQTTRDSAAWAGHCSAKKHAALRPTNSPAQAQISGPAPLQLQVVLVRGEGELSLRTSNGANHAQRDQQIILGTNPGRDSNGVALLVNMVSRQPDLRVSIYLLRRLEPTLQRKPFKR